MLLNLLAPIAIVASAQPALPRSAEIMTQTRRVADWQIANAHTLDFIPTARASTKSPRDWQQATFWVALTELADRNKAYAPTMLALGKKEAYQLGHRPFHADDQLIAQAWMWTAKNGAGPAALTPTRTYFDNVLRNRRTGSLEFIPKVPGTGDSDCVERWCWCDALFMAPTSLLKFAKLTGDQRYADFAHEEFRKTTEYLWDPAEHLYFRDSRFFERRDAKGRKLFWSRGNGWVMGGLVRILQTLDKNDANRPYYLKLYREMAAKLVTLQKPDGYWAPSLLDTDPGTPRESSGTGFYTYAFAWGVNVGILDRKTYEPAAIKGWGALVRSVQPDGMLGWVQQVSDRPDTVAAKDTQYYGVGAFVLAGTAMYDLSRKRGR